jgi:multicomponent Na+:H+ antiporter subunit F
MKNASAVSFDPVALALPIAGGLLAATLLLAAWRLWRGPTDADRILALDLMTGAGLAVVVLLALEYNQPVFIDVAVALGVIGFVGTAVLARRLDRKGEP